MAGRKEGTQIARVLATLRLVLAAGKHGMSARELASALGSSPRQAQRYLDTLTEVGVEVTVDQYTDNSVRYRASADVRHHHPGKRGAHAL